MRPVIVLGAGGHAKVVIAALKAAGVEIIGVTDPDSKTHGRRVLGVKVLGGDEVAMKRKPDQVVLVNGVGSTRPSPQRRDTFERFKRAGFTFRAVIHPSAVIGPEVEIGEGAQVMAGAVVQPGCRIGHDAIINTRASVDHDCVVGDHAHVAPGVVLGGGVLVGDGAHVGAGATVIQCANIGDGALIAAGATVVADVAAGSSVAGTPATEM
jgi:UDP-perosamine 4-acetyltransferase